MRLTKTDTLLAELNAKRGLRYPLVGYTYFANLRGDGRNIRAIYTIINQGGGVTYSHLNDSTPKGRLAKIVRELANVPKE